ncbi:T9SS type A sorting domain-containing protein [Neolewinella agarilytica]|uniref:Por secretion system C-terminal sorting domain-containing protein n=1 Tax=Neolewinella agarilytica TaxID=478744 RepID=A0A1H9L7T7_9BACT|nr:T9SS type A sorting domain-containing protein [Neolewinella agarilytica]SER07227.1 Por secretion system C-terminal sorting domain-containing protein [Neolewinella agarilytica]
MIKKLTSLLVLSLLLVGGLMAQTRYVDKVFSDVSVEMDLTYSTNIDPLAISQGATGPTPQLMNVYQPVGDTVDTRPVVVVFHTGNFLPQYFNGGPYGARNDSAVVEITTRLVERGYVGIAATYRKGWQPTAAADSIRTGSLLQAVYRASQDAHAMARFLRKSVAEEGNPYGIDTSRIVFFGIGSGGYVVQTHNYLDRTDEILQNLNFYTPSGIPLVNESVNSNPQGTILTMQNVPNHVGYSSEVAFTYNVGGALGDTLWMDGTSNEAPAASLHSLSDPFAPFYAGTVIVPTNPPMPVVDVQGSNLVMLRANARGNNDVLAPANALSLDPIFDPLSSVLNQITAGYKTVQTMSPIQTATADVFQLGQDNLWTVLRTAGGETGASGATSGLQNWFDEATLRGTIAAINAAIPDANLSADDIINGEDQTNPNRANPTAAKAFVDTIMAHFIPRAYYALDIDALVSTNDLISNQSIGLEVFPNPASEGFTVRTEQGHPIRSLRVMDMNGRIVTSLTGINATSRFVNRNNLPRGAYLLQIQLDEGTTARKLILE